MPEGFVPPSIALRTQYIRLGTMMRPFTIGRFSSRNGKLAQLVEIARPAVVQKAR